MPHFVLIFTLFNTKESHFMEKPSGNACLDKVKNDWTLIVSQ